MGEAHAITARSDLLILHHISVLPGSAIYFVNQMHLSARGLRTKIERLKWSVILDHHLAPAANYSASSMIVWLPILARYRPLIAAVAKELTICRIGILLSPFLILMAKLFAVSY